MLNKLLGVEKIFDLRRDPPKPLRDFDTGKILRTESGEEILSDYDGHWIILSAEFGNKYKEFTGLAWGLVAMLLFAVLMYFVVGWANRQDAEWERRCPCVSLSKQEWLFIWASQF